MWSSSILLTRSDHLKQGLEILEVDQWMVVLHGLLGAVALVVG